MDMDQRRQAAHVLCTNTEYAAEQRIAAGVIATRLKFRPQKAAKLPPEKMASYLLSVGSIDETLAGALVRAYLFNEHQPMLTMFLDDLQIPHEKGVIAGETVVRPEADALRTAVERIRGQFNPADVDLYLAALLASDPVTWENVAGLVSVAQKEG